MNAFSKHPQLNCIATYDTNSPSDSTQLAHKMIIDHLIANAQLFLRKLHSPANYMDALQTLDRSLPRLPSTVRRSYVVGKIFTEAATLAPALGLSNFIAWLRRLKAAPHIILKAPPGVRRKSEAELASVTGEAKIELLDEQRSFKPLQLYDRFEPGASATVEEIFRGFPDIEWVTGRPTVIAESGAMLDISPIIPFPRQAIAAGIFDRGDSVWNSSSSTAD